MSFSELPFRTKANYIFFWINLFLAFMLAFNGSLMGILHLAISFLCWAYKYGILLSEKLQKQQKILTIKIIGLSIDQ